MNAEMLENEILTHLKKLSNSDLRELDNLEHLLISEFFETGEGARSSLWTDCFRDSLEAFEDQLLEYSEFRNFLINIGKIDTHIVCGAFYVQDQLNVWSETELDRIAELPLCEEDNGREDSCFGVHFFISFHQNTKESTLQKLLEKEYDDEAFFPWLVARSSSSPQLLDEIAEHYKSASTWRAWGEYMDGLILLDNYRDSFVLWQVKKNPNTSKETLEKFENDIEEIQLKESTPTDHYPFSL